MSVLLPFASRRGAAESASGAASPGSARSLVPAPSRSHRVRGLGLSIRRFRSRHARLVAAILAALAAAVLTNAAVHQEASTPVVVATRELAAGVVIQSQDVTTLPYPSELVPSDSTDSARLVVGRRLATAVSAREPITGSRLASTHSLPAGKVALAVPVDDALAGWLTVGDQVTVYPGRDPALTTSVNSAAGYGIEASVLALPSTQSNGTLGLNTRRTITVVIAVRSQDANKVASWARRDSLIFAIRP